MKRYFIDFIFGVATFIFFFVGPDFSDSRVGFFGFEYFNSPIIFVFVCLLGLFMLSFLIYFLSSHVYPRKLSYAFLSFFIGIAASFLLFMILFLIRFNPGF